MTHKFLYGATDEQAQIHKHLVVAAASAVNLLTHIAKALSEEQFHLAMHVFNAVFYLKLSFFYLCIYLAQFAGENAQFIGSEQFYRLQHNDVRQRAKHVITRQIHIHLTVATHCVSLYIVVHRNGFFPKF